MIQLYENLLKLIQLQIKVCYEIRIYYLVISKNEIALKYWRQYCITHSKMKLICIICENGKLQEKAYTLKTNFNLRYGKVVPVVQTHYLSHSTLTRYTNTWSWNSRNISRIIT